MKFCNGFHYTELKCDLILELHVNSAFSSCKSSFLPFGCNTFTVVPPIIWPPTVSSSSLLRQKCNQEFVQSIRASVGYLGAAGLELDPNLQHRSMCHPGDRAKPRSKDRYTYSITQVRAKSKPTWDSWAHGQGLGRGPRWGWSGPLRENPALGVESEKLKDEVAEWL